MGELKGVDGWMDLWVRGWVLIYMDREMHGLMDRQVEDGEMGESVDGWMNGCTGRRRLMVECMKGKTD